LISLRSILRSVVQERPRHRRGPHNFVFSCIAASDQRLAHNLAVG